MTKKEKLYEGKAKKVFATDDPELLIVSCSAGILAEWKMLMPKE